MNDGLLLWNQGNEKTKNHTHHDWYLTIKCYKLQEMSKKWCIQVHEWWNHSTRNDCAKNINMKWITFTELFLRQMCVFYMSQAASCNSNHPRVSHKRKWFFFLRTISKGRLCANRKWYVTTNKYEQLSFVLHQMIDIINESDIANEFNFGRLFHFRWSGHSTVHFVYYQSNKNEHKRKIIQCVKKKNTKNDVRQNGIRGMMHALR